MGEALHPQAWPTIPKYCRGQETMKIRTFFCIMPLTKSHHMHFVDGSIIPVTCKSLAKYISYT